MTDFEDLLRYELGGLFLLEKRLAAVLPEAASAVSSAALRECLEEKAECAARFVVTIKNLIGGEISRGGARTEALEALFREGTLLLASEMEPGVKDAALISFCQSILHYEVACCRSSLRVARMLSNEPVVGALTAELEVWQDIVARIESGDACDSTKNLPGPAA